MFLLGGLILAKNWLTSCCYQTSFAYSVSAHTCITPAYSSEEVVSPLLASSYVSVQRAFVWVLSDWAELPLLLLCMHMDNGF